MLRLSPARRAVLAEAFRELASLSAGALVLGQFVGPQRLSWETVLAGLAVWVALISMAVTLTKENRS